MKRPTQADVAQIAGVSRATVSYVLNERNGRRIPISGETRKRVLEAVAQLGYEPDARARALRDGRTKTIGVLFPTLQNPYFWQILHGVSSEAQAAGYSLLLSQSSMTPEQELHSLKELAQQRVDGLILLFGFKLLHPQVHEQLRSFGRPVIEHSATPSPFDHALNNYGDGTRELMRHLLELGHRRIGFVYGVLEEAQGSDRLDVYRDVLQRAGLFDDSLIHRCGPTMEDGHRATRALLERPERPTALLAINDLLGVAALRAAADLGLGVPGDVSVASFDGIPFVEYTVPRLTSVEAPSEESGRAAVRMLLERLDDPDRPYAVFESRPRLVIRESTGPPPTAPRVAAP